MDVDHDPSRGARVLEQPISGATALLFFYGVFWAGLLASAGRYRVFDTTLFFHTNASRRLQAWQRLKAGVVITDLAPLAWLIVLYHRIVPNNSECSSILMAGLASLSLFAFVRILHAVVATSSWATFYCEDEYTRILCMWNPRKSDWSKCNTFGAHFVPGLGYLLVPITAALLVLLAAHPSSLANWLKFFVTFILTSAVLNIREPVNQRALLCVSLILFVLAVFYGMLPNWLSRGLS